jgi:hypothetical protein
MNYIILFFVLFYVSYAQTTSPSTSPTNHTIPDQATLRPTTTTTTIPTVPQTMVNERKSFENTSGEPSRGVVAGLAVAYCAILTSLGVWSIATDSCDTETRQGGFSKVIKINYDD